MSDLNVDPAERFAALYELLDRRPAWQKDSACRDYPLSWWFPNKGETTEPAKAICAGCLVAEECAAYAAGFDSLAGVWAGLSERGRKATRRLEVRAPDPRWGAAGPAVTVSSSASAEAA
jgi:WhiB family redox-sensing transcriptional regulator